VKKPDASSGGKPIKDYRLTKKDYATQLPSIEGIEVKKTIETPLFLALANTGLPELEGVRKKLKQTYISIPAIVPTSSAFKCSLLWRASFIDS